MDNFIKVAVISLVFIILSAVYIISRFMRISYMRDTLLDVRINAFKQLLAIASHDCNEASD